MGLIHSGCSKKLKKQIMVVIFLFITILLLISSEIFKNKYNILFSDTTILTWHNLFEFISALICFAIFIFVYFTYDGYVGIRMLILGCTFLVVGFLDVFHTLSYVGMPVFFIPNISSNRSTTFWALSILMGSIGIFTSVVIYKDNKIKVRKFNFILPIAFAIGLMLVVVTFFPDFFPLMFIDGVGATTYMIMIESLALVFLIFSLAISIEYYKKSRDRYLYYFVLGIFFTFICEIILALKETGFPYFIGHLYKVIAYLLILKSIYSFNINRPFKEMKKAKNHMRNYSNKLNSLIKERNRELEEINQKLMMDIEYAKDIQKSLLPTKMPDMGGITFEAGYMPADRLSGDFYNVLKLDDENIAIYIGDVSGHGVSAAMLTIFAYQNLKPIKETDENTFEIISPGYTLKGLYKAFNQTNFKDETYMVAVCGIYNTRTKCFTYSSAGINVPPLIIKKCGQVSEMEVRGFAICKLGEIIMPYFEDRVLQLEDGDKLFFYTDGLVEAENQNGIKFTECKLQNIIENNYSLDGHKLGEIVKNEFYNFVGRGRSLKDDVTFLIVDIN